MAVEIAVLENPKPSSPSKSRLVYLDNIRTLLITCVVLGHISASYGIIGDWYYYEAGQIDLATNSLMLIAAAIGIGFALGLFFMIAGYFTPPAYDRKGASQFILDRLKRLGIPLLIFEIIVNPLVHFAVDSHGGDCHGSFYDCQFQGTFWQYLQEYPGNLGSIADGPVWFLEALFFFSVLYAGWRLATKRFTRPVPEDASRTRLIPSNTVIALYALAIGLVTFIVRLWALVFDYYEPWHLEFAHFPQYIAMFIVGLWAYRYNWFKEFSDQQARIWRWVALVCVLAFPALLVAFGALTGNIDERAGGGMNWLSFAYSLWEGFLCVSMSITILTWFRSRFDHQSKLGKAMSDASFGVYVLHVGIVVPLALALSPIRMNLSFKFLITAPFALALSYLVVYLLRKIPLVRSIMG